METRLKALAQASARIFAAPSLEETLRLTTAAAREIVGAHQAVTSLTTDGSWAQAIVSVSLSDKYAAWCDFDAKPSGKGIYARVCAENRPMRLTQAELEANPGFKRFSDTADRHPPLRGWLAAPLVARDGANLGLVQLSDKNQGDFDENDEALLVQLAQLAGLAVENLRLVEAARAAERRFEEFATLGNEVLWETDAEHRYTLFLAKDSFRMNSAPSAYLGKTRWEAALADPASPLWVQHIAELEAHRPIRNFEYPVPRRDGSMHYLRVSADPKFDAAGKFLGYRGATTNVTDLRRAEATAKTNEQRFHEFAKLGSDVLWETDAQHRYTLFLVKGSFRMRREPEWFIGKTHWEATRVDIRQPFWAAHLADLDAHRPLRNFEFSVTIDGKPLHLRVDATPKFDDAGRFTGYRGTTQDVTELRRAEAAAKASEERFRQFAGIASDWLWETDAAHRFTFFAGAAGTIPQRPFGKTRWELAGADLADPKWRAHLDDIAAERPFRNFEYTRIDETGRTRYIAVSGQPYHGVDGAFAGYRGTATDITAQREAEAEARKAAEQYRNIVETANEGVWILDAAARTVFVNRRMAEMLGYAPEEMLGRPVYDFRPPEDRAARERRWAALQEGASEQREARFTRRDGTVFWAQISAASMKDANGNFAGALGMVSDITARKEAEEAVRASEDRFRDFAEVGTDWMWETDAEHRVTMLDGPPGRAAGFAFGKRRWEYGGVDPDAPEWRRHRADLDLHLPFRNFEYQLHDTEGAVRYFSLSGKPLFDAAGTFTGYRGTTRDITAQRQAEAQTRASEQRFKDFAGVASDWMWETDGEHRFSYFSPSRDLSQRDASAAALGQTRWGYAGADLGEPKWQAHLADLAARRPFRGFEYQYRRPDGSLGTSLINGVPVFSDAGAFMGYRGTATDITSQRAAEAAARESERKYRHIVETANEGIWMLDADRRTTYVNPRMAEMLGYAPEEMLGRHHWDFMAPADRAVAIEATRQRPDDGVERVELRYLRKDGRPIWVIVTSNVVDDPSSGAPAVLGMVTDITDRKAAEEALRAAEAAAREAGERFRHVVETANEGLWIVGEDTRITFANRRVAEMFGYEPEELPGRSFLDFVPAHRREEAHRHWRERSAGKTDRFEARHLKKDGSEVWVLISTTPQHDAQGVFRGTITMFVDISDRKAAEAAAAASEARFRDFAEVAADWMWETDAEHRLTFKTGAPLAVGEAPIGNTRWALAGAGADDPAWRRQVEAMEARLPFRDCEFTVKGAGRLFYLVSSGRPVFDDAGAFLGYRGTTADRTVQRQAEAAAAASEKQFRQFVETANEGVWMIDAELRTTYANQRILELLGYAADEVVGRSFLDFKFPADHAESMRMWNERKNAGLERIETRLKRRDGRSLWVLLSATPRFDAEGKLAGSFMMLVDITARKEAEKAAARAKRELDAILASSSEGVAGLDNQWRYTYLNPAGERIAKVSAKDVVGRTGFDVYDLDMSNVFHQCYLEAKRDNQPVSLAAYSDVYEGWQEVRAYPHSEGLTVFFRDVTAERQAHLALAESERKLRAALENNESILASISDGFVALDNDWRFTFINPAAERMWNKKAADLLGNTIFDSLHVDPANPFHSNYLDSKAGGEPIAFAAFSDMFEKWLEVRGYPHAGGYTIFFDDVTEERSAHRALLKSEEKLEAAREMNERIFETSLDLICITDQQGTFVQVNAGASQQFGYAKEELVGHNASEFIDADGIVVTRSAMRDARTSQTLHTFENRCRRKDGQWVPMNWSVAWSEREQKYFFIGRDMSERMEAQERLNRSQRLEAIGQLTGGIAHDFNNLLTVIMGNSDTLARGLADNDRLRRRAELSLEAARRAAELTAQLLAFARRQTLAPKAVEANKLVHDLHELMQRSLGTQVEIEIVPAKDLWLCKVDSTQLETALLNLALNARDAMPGGGRLTIATSNRTVAAGAANGTGELAVGDYVAIEVADTGTGMPPEVLARAFEPFFTTKDIGKGSGLGLAMVYGFVKQSGGSAAIASEPGRGTRVTLYLPRAQEAAPAAAAPAAREGTPLPGGRETILVVEDDAAVRELVTDQLKTLGYRVLVAGNGRTARNILFGGEKVDLLFTDVMMPGGVTGTQLADEAEKQLPSLKILFTTGYAEVPALKNSRRGVALLRKPYKTRDLAHTVREMLDTDM